MEENGGYSPAKQKKKNLVTVRLNDQEISNLIQLQRIIARRLEEKGLAAEDLGLSSLTKSSVMRFCFRLLKSGFDTEKISLDDLIEIIAEVIQK